MKPLKKWEPQYRFGGNPAEWLRPAPLGTTHRPIIKPKRKKK